MRRLRAVTSVTFTWHGTSTSHVRTSRARDARSKFTIQYDGTDYVGWQRQSSGIAIQQLIEDALAPIEARADGHSWRGPDGCGRARARRRWPAQGSPTSSPVRRSPGRMNAVLPLDVRVLDGRGDARRLPRPLHARSKTYEYRIVNAPWCRRSCTATSGTSRSRSTSRRCARPPARSSAGTTSPDSRAAGTPVSSTERTILALDVEDGGGFDLPLVIRDHRRRLPPPHGPEHRRHPGRGRDWPLGPVAAAGGARLPRPVAGRPHGAAAGAFSDACRVLSRQLQVQLPSSKAPPTPSSKPTAHRPKSAASCWSLGVDLDLALGVLGLELELGI